MKRHGFERDIANTKEDEETNWRPPFIEYLYKSKTTLREVLSHQIK